MNILLESGKRSNGMVVIPNRTKIPVIAWAASVFARSVLVSTAGSQPMSPSTSRSTSLPQTWACPAGAVCDAMIEAEHHVEQVADSD